MKTLGNIIWIVFIGAWSAIAWLIVAGAIACTIVGLPFARQAVKLARFSAWPFGRVAVPDPTATSLGAVGAVLWFVPGVFMAVGYMIGGAITCLTVVGIPFGKQSFKLASLAIAPFGKRIVRISDLTVAA
jgi:uncharacterized membrane protein YccF (DUF307 family)